jgi:hypothetical protein
MQQLWKRYKRQEHWLRRKYNDVVGSWYLQRFDV